MNTHELIQKLTMLKSALRRDTEFVRVVENLSERFVNLLFHLDRPLGATTPDNMRTLFTEYKQLIDGTVDEIKKLSFTKTFIDMENTKAQLENLHQSFDIIGNTLPRLINAISEFQESFDALIKNYRPSQTIILASQAKTLSESLKLTINFTDTVITALLNDFQIKEEEQALSIVFPSTDEYKDVVNKLEAFEQIYIELCPLFNVSTSEYPLRIVKIETGSLWINIIGSTLVLGFMVWLIKATLGFIYRNYTIEGKISAIPRDIKAADSILEFTKKLEEAGINTTSIKEEIEKAIFTCSSNLTRLVADQPSVNINNETYSVGDAQQEKFLQESKALLLKGSTQTDLAQHRGSLSPGNEASSVADSK